MILEHAAAEAPNANEYIVHHLSFLSNKEAQGIVDFSVIHWDSVFFAVLLAIPFVLGSLRSAGAGTRMMMGLLLGLAFFLLQRLIESSTVLFNLNPVLLAWLPTTLLALVTLGLLARAR